MPVLEKESTRTIIHCDVNEGNLTMEDGRYLPSGLYARELRYEIGRAFPQAEIHVHVHYNIEGEESEPIIIGKDDEWLKPYVLNIAHNVWNRLSANEGNLVRPLAGGYAARG